MEIYWIKWGICPEISVYLPTPIVHTCIIEREKTEREAQDHGRGPQSAQLVDFFIKKKVQPTDQKI